MLSDDMVLHLLKTGKLTERMLRSHLAGKTAESQRLRQQRDSANALIDFLMEQGDASVHKDRN